MNTSKTTWLKKAVGFLICQGISLFGSSVTQFALVWFITLKTSSGKWVSALTICSFLPQMLISFASGVWADRYNKKWLIIAADAAIAIVTLILAFVTPHTAQTTTLFVLILIAAIFRSVGTGIQTPAVGAVIPEIVPEEHLMRFNGINAAIQSAVQFAAPAVAGAVLSFSSFQTALYIDIATAVIGIIVLCFIKLPAVTSTVSTTEKPTVIADLKNGLNYARNNHSISRLLVTYGIFIFLSIPGGFQAGLFTTREFGSTYWYLTAVEVIGFAGMALGGIIIGAWGGFKKRHLTLAAGLSSFGLLCVIMGLSYNFIFYLAVMLILGIALTMFQTASTTLIQENAAPNMQGRVFSFLSIIYSGSLSLGMLIFGVLADAVSMRILMIVTGALLILTTGTFRLWKAEK